MTDQPLVTVCMASYNSARTIERAVTSILNQTHTNVELLVFDAASHDRTPAILRALEQSDPRIRITLRAKQQPFVDAFADGLEQAKGEFFCLLDADDFVSKNWISTLLSQIDLQRVIGTFGKLVLCDTEDNLITHLPSNCRTFAFTSITKSYSRVNRFIMTPENEGKVNMLYALWRTEIIRSVGTWSSQGERADDDYLFCLRMLARGPVACVDDAWICRTVPSVIGNFDLATENEFDEWAIFDCLPTRRRWSSWSFPPILQFARFMLCNPIGYLMLPTVSLRALLAITAFPLRLVRKTMTYLK